MADPDRNRKRAEDAPSEEERPRLSAGDIWRLILRSYRDTFPYLVIFLAAFLLVTWIVTRVLF